MADSHEGGCLCGQVRYRASGPPLRTLACHCTFCQKFTGASANVEALFPTSAVEFFGADMAQYSHASDTSGRLLHLHFCRRCGTTVSITFEGGPTTRALLLGTFDAPNRWPIDAHVWIRSAPGGVALPAHTDCFLQARMNADGSLRPATRFDAPVMAADLQAAAPRHTTGDSA